jgi:thiol-disulfide isomerase/thioredoxin
MNAPDTKRKTLIAVLLAGAVAAGAAFLLVGPGAVLSPAPPPMQASPLATFAKGAMAAFIAQPELKPVPALAFKDATGADASLDKFRGKVVLLNLWATWCAPCRAEMPALNALQKELGGKDFEVVALSLDLKGIEVAQKFLTEVKADGLTTYIDGSAKALTTLQAPGLPTTLLIDREGRELGRLLGPAEWNSPEAKALIGAAIAPSG